jgi:hypothetical protein
MHVSDDQIEEAKRRTHYSNHSNTGEPNHEHPDCIRIAVQWLDAQRRLKSPAVGRGGWPLKHIIESWGGRYVSMNDVEVAATILGLRGIYPYFNISSRLTKPSLSRLEGIEEAMKHPNYLEMEKLRPRCYTHAEESYVDRKDYA